MCIRDRPEAWIVVPGDIEERHIESTDQIFEVVEWQVAT